jgi:DnaJ-class molecular chaperone
MSFVLVKMRACKAVVINTGYRREDSTNENRSDVMPGYNPNCKNCNRCGTCHGEGWIYMTRSVGPGKVIKEQVTCPTCRGVGGKPGAGSHNHL